MANGDGVPSAATDDWSPLDPSVLIHVCLGAPLARLQIRAGLTRLHKLTTRFEVVGEVRRSIFPSDTLAEFPIGFR